MKFFKLSFDTAILRFYLMMVLTLVPFFLGLPYLAILAVPVFLSIMLGVSFKDTAQVGNWSVIQNNSSTDKIPAHAA